MRLPVLFFICLFFFALSACNFKEKRAKEYHDNILQSVQQVIDNSLDYADAVQSYKKSEAQRGYEKYSALVNSTLLKLEKLKDFEGDTTMEYYSKELLNFYKQSLQNNIQPFLQSVEQETFSPKEVQTADSLITDFNMSENQYWERFNWAEKKFYKEQGLFKVEK